jgi:hypothetical protein
MLRPVSEGIAIEVVRMPSVVVDAVKPPVAVQVEPPPPDEPDTEGDARTGVRPPRRSEIHDRRVVHRHVNDLRLRGDDAYNLLLDHNLLLRRRRERSRSQCPGAHLLDARHDVLLLTDERLTQPDRPVKLVVHHREDSRIVRNRDNTGVPVLIVKPLRTGMLTDPTRSLDDLQGIGRRGQDLRQERIGIEGDGGEQVVEFLAAESSRGGLG